MKFLLDRRIRFILFVGFLSSLILNIFLFSHYSILPKAYHRFKNYYIIDTETKLLDYGNRTETPIIYATDGRVVKNILPIAAESANSAKLPNDLFIQKGTYKINKKYSVNLNLSSNKGFLLLRVIFPKTGDYIQRILLFENFDENSILSAIKLIHRHGSKDNPRKQRELMEVAKIGELELTCGAITQFAKNVLEKFEIKSQLFLVMKSKHDERNAYDDGHTMLEVQTLKGGEKRLYDMSLGYLFIGENKESLSALEAFSAVQKEKVSFVSFVDESFNLCNYSNRYSGLMLSVCLKPLSWYKRLFKTPFFLGDDKKWRTPKTFFKSFEHGNYDKNIMLSE